MKATSDDEVIAEIQRIKYQGVPPSILDARVVDALRRMKSLEETPSVMLKYLKNDCAITYWIDVIRYFRLAFTMSLKEAKPVTGWLSGELSDERIDQLISESEEW